MNVKILQRGQQVVLKALAAVMVICSSAASAGPGTGEDKPSLVAAYYTIVPGKEDEWLALYKKWHEPLMIDMIKEGLYASAKVYTPSYHSPNSWSIKVVFIAPPADKARKPSSNMAARIRRIFPDTEAYAAGEKTRWALTTAHWDEFASEVDMRVEQPSVYFPDGVRASR